MRRALTAGLSLLAVSCASHGTDTVFEPPPTPAPERPPNLLDEFRAERRRWIQEHAPRPTGPWPLPILIGWRNFLNDLEPLWTDPRTGSQAVRLYVVVEAELDLCQRQWGPAPEVIREALGAVRGELARRGGWRPAPSRPAELEWPVSPIIVTSVFGYRHDPIEGRRRFHGGIDLGGHIGDPVTAATTGRVVFAGWRHGYGRLVVLRHGSEAETWYAHLSRLFVKQSDLVLTGDVVGLMGDSGRTTGPHLHFEVRRGPEPLDPQAWIGRPVTELIAQPLRLSGFTKPAGHPAE